jgi:streptogramin lyase
VIRRKLSSLALVVALFAGLIVVVGAPVTPAGAVDPVGTVTNFDLGNIRGPYAITAGLDGNVWFANTGDNTTAPTDTVGRMTTAGDVTEFETGCKEVRDITTDAGGNIWFACSGSITRTTSAGAMTSFTDPALLNVEQIAAGADGNIWFTDRVDNLVGRMTPAGAVTTFTDASIVNPEGITAGPDGAVWFTNQGTPSPLEAPDDSIGRVTPAGSISSYADPNLASPVEIASGSDGALWFANHSRGIGRLSTSGAFTYYSTGRADEFIGTIAASSDGNLWFDVDFRTVGRMTTAGSVQLFDSTSEHPILGASRVTGGPGGGAFFSFASRDEVVRLTSDGVYTRYQGDRSESAPSIATGTDGRLWFPNSQTVNEAAATSALDPSGALSSYVPASPSIGYRDPGGIISGTDGNLYIAARGNSPNVDTSSGQGIWRMTPAGDLSLLTGSFGGGGITNGPDGKIWYGAGVAPVSFPPSASPAAIWRTTTDGTRQQMATLDLQSEPRALTTGPDGNVWFVNERAGGASGFDEIGRVTPNGVLTRFADARLTFDETASIAAGPDGNLWFTNPGGDSIGRITPAGVITLFTDPSVSAPAGIVEGRDDNLWFANSGNNSIGRITTDGVVTNYTDPTISKPRGITVGPDGAIWFTNTGHDSIGRVQALRSDAATMVYPANGAYVGGGTFLVAVGGTGVNAMEFRVTGGTYHDTVVDGGADFGAFGWWGGWGTAAAAEGSYQIVAVGRDGSGDAGVSPPITITVDHTPPNTAVTLPANNAYVHGGQFFLATASDNNKVDKVEYLIDNTVVSNGLSNFGWFGGWQTSTTPDGTHTLRSRATDAAGNTKFSAPLTITVDNTVPNTTLLSPTSNATVRGSIFLNASGTDNIKVVKLEYFVDGNFVSGSTLTAFGWLGGWDTRTVSNGVHQVWSVITDAAGNGRLSQFVKVNVQN